jgi:hypothetical protein
MASPTILLRVGEEGLDALLIAMRQKKKMDQQNSKTVATDPIKLSFDLLAIPAIGGAIAGAHIGHKARKEPIPGALRGSVGATAGSTAGLLAGTVVGMAGGHAYHNLRKALGEKYPNKGKRGGRLLAHELRKHHGRNLNGLVAGAILGTGLGMYGGYKALTHKYDKPKSHTKHAFALGAYTAKHTLGLEKEANIFDTAKAVGKTLTAHIPGTKPWLLSAKSPSIGGSVRPSKLPTKMRPPRNPYGSSYDVSAQAREMGL